MADHKITRKYFLKQSSAALAAATTGTFTFGTSWTVQTSKNPYDFVLVDGHRDPYEFFQRIDAGETSPLKDNMLSRFLEGGIDVVVMPVGGTHPRLRHGNHKVLEGTLQVLDMILREIEKTEEQVVIIRSKEDLPERPGRNKIHFFLDLEGGEPISVDPESGFSREKRLALVRTFYRMGVRGLQLTHHERNYLADGIEMDREGKKAGGLTDLGVEVVEELNRLGMMVGVSHLAERGILETAEISTAPIVSTHTNIRPFIDTTRKFRQHTDRAAKAIASTGGVIGLRYIYNHRTRTPYELLVDQIDHLSDIIGVEHIGMGWFGNDAGFFGTPGRVSDVESRTMYEQRDHFMQLLSKRGYIDDHIGLIMGGNFMRIWKKILPG